jgi:hypothetical protein
MQTTQLACPHCGSMLNLGGVILPGTPVTCLICSQSFAAAPIDVGTAEPAKPAPAVPTAPKPQAGILVSKPYAAAAPERMPPSRPTPTLAEQSLPTAGGKLALWTTTLSLLVLLTAGTGFALWKLNAAGREGPAGNLEQLIAANQAPGAQPKDSGDTAPADPAKGKDATTDKPLPASNDSPDDDVLRMKKEAQKKLLKRKPSADSASKEPELDPITAIDVPGPSVPGVEPVRVNAAIGKGVGYLKRTQAANGAWPGGMFPVGSAALAGLTLLECKAAPNDLHVQRAAYFVRGNAGTLSMTYEISLTILFLDRLGDPRDRALIQGLALRLLAGQRECGGWTYDCPPLSAKEMYQLYTFLRSHKAANSLAAKKNNGPALNAADKKPNKGTDPFNEFGAMIAEKEPAKEPKDDPPTADKKAQPGVKQVPQRPNMLPPQLRNLPVVRNQEKTKANLHVRIGPGAGDNSNTQFALLALWAARRHEIPGDAALLTAYQRFVISQVAGTWPYVPQPYPSECSFTMIPAGLLGLAMGHGVAPEVVKGNPNDPKDVTTKPALQDPKIGAGLKTLAANIGDVSPDKDNVGQPANMYFLWSLERVAMLYDLQTIEGKNWYGWGAQKLLKHQNVQGDWPSAQYPGQCAHVNTCFALLFLKRSNLVQDLTLHLRLATSERDGEK